MAGFAFRSKAETLEALAPLLGAARILPLFHVSVAEWRADGAGTLARLAELDWASRPLIVRSSAAGEDGAEQSLAGKFLSVPDTNTDTLSQVMEQVAASYGAAAERDPDADRILIQPMLADVVQSGVAFTRDPSTGSPYLVINGADGADTALVTSGREGKTWTHTHWLGGPEPFEDNIKALLVLSRELTILCSRDALDLEFAFTADGVLWLLQVRPLVVAAPVIEDIVHTEHMRTVMAKVATAMCPHPLLHGARTVLGVMPDWNPAEMIGVRPTPLALSLYRDLITDGTWAYQRHNYGYRNLRSFPLLIHLEGQPYIDVRVSFNSFVPRYVDSALAEKLVDWYLERLLTYPALHDKVEFEIVLSAYTFDLPQRLDAMTGFTADERTALADSLRRLTNRIIHRETGLWQEDIAKLAVLEERRALILDSRLRLAEKVYWLLEDCKRYGTLPFAGLARAGFIAVQMLRSLVVMGVLEQAELDAFMGGLNTVGSELSHDTKALDRGAFLAKYGHLRPGTYDIRSPRYDVAPEIYGIGSRRDDGDVRSRPRFGLSLPQMRRIEALLKEHGLDNDVVGLFDFFQAAIEGREKAKFIFTRSLSDALELVAQMGEHHGLSRDDLAFADISVIKELQASSASARVLLGRSIAEGHARYLVTKSLLLPPLITNVGDVWSFRTLDTEPNFVTLGEVTAPVRTASEVALDGAIVCIPGADPGYDWIFGRNIGGLLTAFGGANSHMAIRAAELGIPAVIGAGEAKYERWSAAGVLRLDCANRRVEVVR